ncbi:MAG: ATP-binding protein [Kiritimatiellae bacterium]|jgi:signal transduction histidine kinase|nr:ATP-binding protein [Kiritimatiellia bacterium]
MKSIPLRKRYFRDMIRMGIVIWVLCMGVLTAFNSVEYWEHREDGPEELIEMVVLIVALIAVFPLIFWVAWRTSGRLLRPLMEMQETVARIQAGELDRRVNPPINGDELSYLVDSLNQAFDAHQSALKRLEHFSADVSHQLRTPLTAMRTEGEVCLSQERSPDAYRETLAKLLEQADRMASGVDQLLTLAKVAAFAGIPDFEVVDLGVLSQEVLASFDTIIQDRQAVCEVEAQDGVTLEGNPWWLSEAISNVVNNSLTYCPDPAHFRLRLYQDGESIIWSFEDNGPGILAAYRDRIFDRYRLAGQRGDGSTGLGLAIVQEIVRLHEGTVSVEDSDLGWCKLVLTIMIKGLAKCWVAE